MSQPPTPGGWFTQDFSGSEIRSGDGGSGGRGGDVGSHNKTKNSNNVTNTTINFYGPQFIVNSDGRSLDLSMSDKKSVISHPFHGGPNQQWIFKDDGKGGFVLVSDYNKAYVALDSQKEGAKLVASDTPFAWNVSASDGGLKLGVPGSDLGISLGKSATAAPGGGTPVVVLENTPENKAAIKAGNIVVPANQLAPRQPELPTTSDGKDPIPTAGFSTGLNINLIFNDASGKESAVNTLKDFQSLFTSGGVKNLTLCLGHHQNESTVTKEPTAPSGNTNLETMPSVNGLKPQPRKDLRNSKIVITQDALIPTAKKGFADIVAFGNDGVYIMRNSVNPTKQLVNADFGYEKGWRVDRHVRLVADTTGDGRPDIVGFGEAGTWISVNNGDGTFGPNKMVIADFGYVSWWRNNEHLRFMADITNTGCADIVGFGGAGVLVSLNNGDGTFGPQKLALKDFGNNAGGWKIDRHVRVLADVSGDGLLDIVGFGEGRVWVAFNNGDGTFQPVKGVLQDLCFTTGWRVDQHPRLVADMTGHGRLDLVGFGGAGVFVAFNNGDGTFKPARLVCNDFGYNQGWRVDKHPRFIADLTGNGCGDIIGMGDRGVFVALNNGDGTFQPSRLVIANMGYNNTWRVEKHPRFVVDLTGDGKADILGFGDGCVYVLYNDGNGNFSPQRTLIQDFGCHGGQWSVEKTPRFIANMFH